MRNTTQCILAGDIGGTKTRLAIFNVTGSQLDTLVEHSYPSQQYASLSTIIEEFTGNHDYRPVAASFGIAGPVRDNRVDTTNLPWHINAADIARHFRIKQVALLNDLEATAWGLRTLDADDFYVLNSGSPNPAGNAAIIAAGTGLGEAGLAHTGDRFQPFATEGGHTTFSPCSELEIELLRFLIDRYGHVSWERVLSGPGLVNLHEFLSRYRSQPVPDWLQQNMRDGDPAAAISAAAQSGQDALSSEALELFAHLYGAEAGNLALKMMASGGIYIGGGIAPRILNQLATGSFMSAFVSKGRMRPLLEQIPVRIILNDRTALYGPAVFVTT